MRIVVFLLITAVAIAAAPIHVSVPSPDGDLVLSVGSESGTPFYTLSGAGAELIEASLLGLAGQNLDLANRLQFDSVSDITAAREQYTLISGKQRVIDDGYNQAAVHFVNADGDKLSIEVRVFDSGAAFRYRIDRAAGADRCRIVYEQTTFNLPQPGTAWMHPYDRISKWTPGYETYYENAVPIGTPAPLAMRGWAFPMLFETAGHWMLVTEAGSELSVGMHLQPECPGGEYKVRFPEQDEAYGVCGVEPVVSLPWSSAWRVILAGPDLNAIVESNVVTSLSADSKLDQTDWIQPGRSSWSWWSLSDSPKDFDILKEFVDFSAQMGWEYSLVDANWNMMENGDLQQLAQYASEQNVGLLVWYNSGGPHNTVGEQLRGRMHKAEARRQEFAWLEKIGVKGIKVDFFQSDKPCIMQQYTDILRDAVDAGLVVNFHGCTIPRGWRRTWPNLLTLESVKGAECYRFDKEFGHRAPLLNTIYPFTRNVIGPMDYTPVTFSHHTVPHHTSDAHELALSVVFESGILHAADHVDVYRSQPKAVQDFLRRVPVVWDETRLISGYPGRDAVMARRSGEIWYIAGINGEFQEKTLRLNFDFLSDASYHVHIISDGSLRSDYDFKTITVNTGDQTEIQIARYGGFAAYATPVK
ncbi:MAG: glycoside hydrolase family 97 catalytic domain-containing protein [candidate division KSB1 bacterium]|nr:glycoside hydrolase family 97 catalytic domain-containing protein [candidate division KSB1 bacterium]